MTESDNEYGVSRAGIRETIWRDEALSSCHIAMKHCSYCGAEYPDDTVECPIDHEVMVGQSVASAPLSSKHEIPPHPANEIMDGWVTILTPRDNIEASIILGRLKVSGIRARFYRSVIGGGLYTDTMTFIQVHADDYDAARDLLNAA